MFAFNFAGFLFLGLILFVTLFYNLIPGYQRRTQGDINLYLQNYQNWTWRLMQNTLLI